MSLKSAVNNPVLGQWGSLSRISSFNLHSEGFGLDSVSDPFLPTSASSKTGRKVHGVRVRKWSFPVPVLFRK